MTAALDSGSQRISFFHGNWKLAAEQQAGPFGPAGPFTGTQCSELSPGGALLIIRASEVRPNGPLEVWTASWYDSVGQLYRMVTDVLGHIATFTGTVNGPAWTYVSDSTVAGAPLQRLTLQELSANSYSWTTEVQQAGGPWILIEQGTATK